MTDIVLDSINNFPKQISQVIDDVSKIDFPASYSNAENIIISGMGGSLFSYFNINHFFRSTLKKPIFCVNDYINPKFLDKNSLFISSSYSGTTEEVLTATNDALTKTDNITGLTVDGALSELLKKNKKIYYQFDPKFNQSGQPRIGYGYMIFGAICILARLGYIDLDNQQLLTAINDLTASQQQIYQQAQGIINEIEGKIIIYATADHLSGVAHVIRNQTNESSKHLAEYNLIPELNHHFMEGLQFPTDKKIVFIFLNSSFFDDKISLRLKLTQEIVEKNNIATKIIEINSANRLSELLNFLQFGGYLTYLLGMKHNVDPSIVPWVDYFKRELSLKA